MSSGLYIGSRLIENSAELASSIPRLVNALKTTIAECSGGTYIIGDSTEANREYVLASESYGGLGGKWYVLLNSHYYYNNEQLPLCQVNSIGCPAPYYSSSSNPENWGKGAFGPGDYYFRYLGVAPYRNGIWFSTDNSNWSNLAYDKSLLFLMICGGGGGGGSGFYNFLESSAGSGGGGAGSGFICLDLQGLTSISGMVVRVHVGRGGKAGRVGGFNDPVNTSDGPEEGETSYIQGVNNNTGASFRILSAYGGEGGVCGRGNDLNDYSSRGRGGECSFVTVSTDNALYVLTSDGGQGGCAPESSLSGVNAYPYNGNSADTISINLIQSIPSSSFDYQGKSMVTANNASGNITTAYHGGGGGGCLLSPHGVGGGGAYGFTILGSGVVSVGDPTAGADGVLIISY